MKPIPLRTMQTRYPLSYSYLKHFQRQLEGRSLHKRWGASNEFYAMYDIGPYTFAPWKVVWKRTTKNFAAAVVSTLPVPECETERLAVPNSNVMMIPFQDQDEAHFVCALLNCSIARSEINASICTKAHADIITVVSIPHFSPENALHRLLTALSKTAHVSAETGHDLTATECEVDRVAAELWGIDDTALTQYRARVAAEPASSNGDGEKRSADETADGLGVLEALEREDGMTAAQIATATGLETAEVRLLLSRLIEDGKVEQVGRGRGTRYRLTSGGEG